jgi:hypothetical protein
MALSPQLKQFEASGVYRLEFDKSQTTSIPTETIRLVVGHSRRGPYNSPVLINDTETFTQIFGGIDKKLERKGMYFHRSALECLSRGSILALNLNPLSFDQNNEEVDRVEYVKPVTNGSKFEISAQDGNIGYSQVFNTDKFWTPEVESTLEATNNTDEFANHAISFINIKQEPVSIIVKKASNTAGFQSTAREWYGEGNVPDEIKPHEYISDYMVDVMVFKGLFDPTEYETDPVYGQFFNSYGIKKDQLNAFANLREVTLEAQYTGSMIPEFKDLEGNNLFIENLINAEARRTGLYCAVNENAIGNLDTVGEQFNIYKGYELLSHIVEAYNPELFTDNRLGSFENGKGSNGHIVYVPYDNSKQIRIKVSDGSKRESFVTALQNNTLFLAAEEAGMYTQIQSVESDNTNNEVVITAKDNLQRDEYENFELTSEGNPSFNETNINDITFNEAGDELTIKYNDSTSFNLKKNGLKQGNYVPAKGGKWAKIQSVNNNTGEKKLVITLEPEQEFDQENFSSDPILADLTVRELKKTTTLNVYKIQPNERVEYFPASSNWNFVNEGGGYFTFTLEQDSANKDPEQTGDGISNIEVGMYVPIQGTDKLGKIQRKSREFIPASANESGKDKYVYRFKSHINVPSRPEYALKSFDAATSAYKTFPIPGAAITPKSISEILPMIKPGNSLSNTLADRDAIEFRYIVDTFGSFEDGVIYNKSEFTQLAAERKNITALLNAPMINELKQSVNPSFKNEFTGEFDVRYIETGGNLKKNPTRLYALPALNEGSDYGVYFSPGLRVVENGKEKIIPPAPYASNNYIDKYTQSVPWAIVAGTTRGVVSGSGVQDVEYPFDENDREIIEPFGWNPIIFQSGVGLVIKGNKTAQQSVKTALSSAHVREVLIYIENGLAEILSGYVFEFNTAQTRLEIKTLADNFLESVAQGDGLYNYKTRMDRTNNTSEIIDKNMGILDTFVEPVKGLEILVARTTILNTGDIDSGNFEVQ